MAHKPFDDLPHTPAGHFRLYFFATVARVLEGLAHTFGSYEGAVEHFPFLALYRDEMAGRVPAGADGQAARAWWRRAINEWEKKTKEHLPLRALGQTAGLDHDCLTLLACAGLVEEDSRFGLVFEAAQESPGQRRPNAGLLGAWWREGGDYGAARANLRRLQSCGLVRVVNADAPRAEWALQVPSALWDLLRGDAAEEIATWARHRAHDSLAALDTLILPRALKEQIAQVPALLASGEAQAIILRGHRHNGRRTVASAIARSLGKGLLEIDARGAGEGSPQVDEEKWRLAGALATCLDALPVAEFDLAPGETLALPPLACHAGALAVALGRQGGVRGEACERALTLTLEMPAHAERREHWRQSLGARAREDLEEISASFRLTGGNIRRAASLAKVYAALARRDDVRLADVREAARALSRETLETLAARVETEGDWSHLAACADTLEELRDLESRCRNRERLPREVGACLGAQMNQGVRALFSGASGTGKTLAARLLAASLGKDLYRLDLSTVVNKYIGETEKNLNQVFARAEELDVILLLDEGDALLTQRTDVSNANDRYANLETNYLLQRLESYEGILIVTTNASDRIDSAFQRRMDVRVNFQEPDAAERWSIWQMHLPEAHEVGRTLLDEVARRCELTGGEIRNAVLHAAALALETGGAVADEHLEAAVRREYRKSGAVCPLRQATVARLAFASRW
jgi:DNA polymerase III delta prime subunit